MDNAEVETIDISNGQVIQQDVPESTTGLALLLEDGIARATLWEEVKHVWSAGLMEMDLERADLKWRVGKWSLAVRKLESVQ
jgi:hypothetical protein